MTQPSTIRLLRARIIAVSALIVACGRGDQKPPDSAGGGTPAPPPPTAAPQPGALTKPIDQYSGDELFAFTHGLAFAGGVERQRHCRGQAGCRGPRPTLSTRIRVDAVDRQDSLSVETVPTNGAVALRAINRGRLADSLYGMQPGAGFEYYLIVLPRGAGGNATWRLEELSTTGGTRSHRSVATGQLRGCNHPFVPGARADFKTCAQATTRPAAFGSRFQTDSDPPLWIACAYGCCTADPPDGRT